MSRHMKAAVLYGPNQPLRLVSGIEVPDPGQGQVLVRLAYSGVCHSQLMEARGKRGEDRFLPHLLGHEGSGVVLATGSGVEKVSKGQKVVLGWIKGRGAEVPATRYRHGDGFINAGAVTTFNEYAVVSENRCVALPDGVPMDVAVLFGCALLTGAGIVTHEIEPPAGSSVAIFGLGGIGMSALMACRLYELEQLIAIDVAPEKRRLAAELGATATIDPASCDPVAEVRRLTNRRGVDFSIEAAGQSQTIEQAFNAVRRGGGWCVFASHPASGERISLDPYELIAGKQIAGSWGGGSDPDRDIPRFAELYRSGKLPLEKLLPHRYALDEINMALDDLEQRRAGRPSIVIDPSVG
jgi:S-(hydroxymethyl)glutathione dehydrogenase / alcohol dehydrogenase